MTVRTPPQPPPLPQAQRPSAPSLAGCAHTDMDMDEGGEKQGHQRLHSWSAQTAKGMYQDQQHEFAMLKPRHHRALLAVHQQRSHRHSIHAHTPSCCGLVSSAAEAVESATQ